MTRTSARTARSKGPAACCRTRSTRRMPESPACADTGSPSESPLRTQKNAGRQNPSLLLSHACGDVVAVVRAVQRDAADRLVGAAAGIREVLARGDHVQHPAAGGDERPAGSI